MASIVSQEVRVFRVPDDASDTAECSARFGIPLEDGANTIVLRFKKESREQSAAIVALADRRIDVNGAVRRALGAQRVSFAPREWATEQCGMEYGGVTAFGLPRDWPILIDTRVMERTRIVMGAGVRSLKLLLRPSTLLTLPNASVHDLLKT
nr:YbaK/EbsC family protein [Caballeronia arvi]